MGRDNDGQQQQRRTAAAGGGHRWRQYRSRTGGNTSTVERVVDGKIR